MGRGDRLLPAGRLQLKPDFAEAHNNLGIAFWNQGMRDEAVVCYRRALQLKPNYAEAHNNLGVAIWEQGKRDEAVACYHRALQLKPDYANAHNNLGILRVELGAFEDAERGFRQALWHEPRLASAWFQLANLLRGRLSEDDLNAMRRLLTDPNLTDDERAALHFGLATTLDARNNYDQAAEHLRQANGFALAKRRKVGQDYDPAVHAGFVDRLLATFTSAFFERVRGFGAESERPIFIFGLPRSGTTLLEQILASHSQVFGAGELPLGGEDFRMLAPSGFTEARAFEAFANLEATTVKRLAERHLEKLQAVDAEALRIVDKMPVNYLYIGLLATLFPKGKFIHCRRDPRDVAVSCWMTNFSEIRWANDPEHIITRFREYQRVMIHWRQVLPVRLLEVEYEETVADLEAVARRLVAWCGLEWEPVCLAFHEGKSRVHTSSATQVRQSLYTRSVGRWKYYESSLGSLFAKLPNNE